MQNQIILETPRLILKGISPSIIHQIFKEQSEFEIKKYFGFDEASYLHCKNMHEKGMETFSLSLFFFLLINKQNNQPIGECGFHTWSKKHNRAEAFYLLRHDADKRKGFMTEAFEIVIQYGFNEMKLHRISAHIANENTASKKLLLKNNFTFEGTLREDFFIDGSNKDSDCYSILKSEYLKNTNQSTIL
jgi:ribosomal-protein-alanine N-acetyltransferase